MISEADIQSMSEFIRQQGLTEQALAELRQRYQGIHMTWAMDDDISGATPFSEGSDFNVYLVDSSEHCSKLTSNPAQASGLVFAECYGDD
ncbi:MAG: hypothetical protein JKY26_01400 [Pseudomonas sp.]|uniref:hypothetical protein n=1 Tax=Thalassolituus oleivorans TaxID=187493 RepID=UPI001A5820E2|nr:hypothetical protein [Thalassolituus oleivorans]MBL4832602.1 hypothetical protein [Pseudomonas sp.]|tara:strand:- start:2065 stop:2334 length:270 start_codon:yes stop_codon:yes gene_type:complete